MMHPPDSSLFTISRHDRSREGASNPTGGGSTIAGSSHLSSGSSMHGSSSLHGGSHISGQSHGSSESGSSASTSMPAPSQTPTGPGAKACTVENEWKDKGVQFHKTIAAMICAGCVVLILRDMKVEF